MADKEFIYERTQEDEDFIAKAAQYAKHIHRTHVRKSVDNTGSTPYFTHLEHVASILRDHQASTIEIVAGYLHDAVEDQGGLPRALDIEHHFGPLVREIVMGCTDSMSSNPDEKKPWQQRKEAYIAKLAVHPIYICRVSAADKISNMTMTITDAKIHDAKILRIFGNSISKDLPLETRREKTLWYHRSIGQIIALRASELGEIAATYATTFDNFEKTLMDLDVSEETN